MEIIFLGTGTSQGVPLMGSTDRVSLSKDFKDKRTRSSVLVKIHSKNILIDCGPDFRFQMLREGLDRVDAILCTHEHADHTAGLDDLRPINFKYKINIPLYSSKRTVKSLKKRFEYIFDSKNHYPGIPLIKLKTLNKHKIFSISDIDITPIKILHEKLPILGYRIENFAYLTDVKSIVDSEWCKLRNLKVLVLSALRVEEDHHSHLILPEAIEIAKRINAKKTFFTHMSHRIGMHKETQKTLPKNMYLAYDGLKIKF